MKTGYQHRRHNKNLLMVHLIFVTKYRRKIFYGEFRNDIKQCLFDICQKYLWYVIRMETDKDHIHMLMQYNPTDSITKIVSKLKQMSTYYMWIKHPDILLKYYWNTKTLWSDGYFAASIGQVSQDTIEKYIEQQG